MIYINIKHLLFNVSVVADKLDLYMYSAVYNKAVNIQGRAIATVSDWWQAVGWPPNSLVCFFKLPYQTFLHWNKTQNDFGQALEKVLKSCNLFSKQL